MIDNLARLPTAGARVRWAVAFVAAASIVGFQIWQTRANVRPVAITVAALRAATPPEMAAVPGGYCWIGSNDADADEEDRPMRRVDVPAFYIDRYEVTNEQFHRFDPSHVYAAGSAKMPATHITYDQAQAYAKSVGKRLPTENEWEKAARGTDGRRYPWGNEWDPKRVAERGQTLGVAPVAANEKIGGKVCWLKPPRVQPVGSIPSGASPYGCEDMAGNAWEWVEGFYHGDPNARVLRGGAVGYTERAFRTYTRALEGSTDTCNDTGFRCVQSPSSL